MQYMDIGRIDICFLFIVVIIIDPYDRVNAICPGCKSLMKSYFLKALKAINMNCIFAIGLL